MTSALRRTRVRTVVGLLAAYAVALQTLFAAFAPLPATAQGADFSTLSVICFGSGNPTGDGDGGARASGKFHCVLCGVPAALAAILPETDDAITRRVSAVAFAPTPDIAPAWRPLRAGFARAPPLTV